MENYHELAGHRVIKPFLQCVFTLEDVLTNSFAQSRTSSGSLYVVKKLELSKLEKGLFKFKLLCTDTERLIVVLVPKSLSSERGLTKIEVGYVIVPCKFLLARCSTSRTPQNSCDLTVCLYLTKLEVTYSPCIPVNIFGQRSIFHHLTRTLLTCDPLIRSSEIDKLVNLSSSSYLSFEGPIMNEKELETSVSASVTCKTFVIESTANVLSIQCDEVDESLQVKSSQKPTRRNTKVNQLSDDKFDESGSKLVKHWKVSVPCETENVPKIVQSETCERKRQHLSDDLKVIRNCAVSNGSEKISGDIRVCMEVSPNKGSDVNRNCAKNHCSVEKFNESDASSSNDLVGSNFALALPRNKTRDSFEGDLSSNGRSSGGQMRSLLDSSGNERRPATKSENQKRSVAETLLRDAADGVQSESPLKRTAGKIEVSTSVRKIPSRIVGKSNQTGQVSKHRAPYNRTKSAQKLKALIIASEDCHKYLCYVDVN